MTSPNINSHSFYDAPVASLAFVDTRFTQEPSARIEIWDHEIFKIGRHAGSNNFVIDDDSDNTVSRNHCELYTVVYEPGITHVYVRDRKSINGTYVNHILIGTGPEISSGYLLQDGDVIEIRPYWKFKFHETSKPDRHHLTDLQAEESKLFAHKYRLTDRCLGQGAEASVYLAIDPNTNKQLVCKVVNLGKLQGRRGREHMRRKFQETDILRQLQHPNILTYIDAICSPHSLYTFTELASGGDLMSFLYRHDQISELDARIIIRQMVRGLHYLHTKGVVHRDLKPENVLFAYSSRIAYHRIMLSDFGTSAVPHRSRMMTFVGTMEYQAPELQARTEPQTMAVDIWSLGLIALLLAAPKHDIPDELNRMSQSDLDRCLTENFRNYCPQPSINAKCFIWGCLQVSPSDRINTTKAECHDWLRTPEKHLEFFRRLDQRMMADWSPKRHLKPMPWELQSLKDALEQPNYSCEDGDQGNGEDDESGLLEADLDDDSSLTSTCFLKPDPGDDEISLVSIPAEFNPPPTWEEATTPLQVQNASKKALSTSQKPRLVSSSDSKAIHQKSQKKRKRKPSKILDSLFLPLTGLERHLRPASTGVKREEILEELKKTNSKFLKEGSSSKRGVPTRETLHPHVEPNTKRQRNKCSS